MAGWLAESATAKGVEAKVNIIIMIMDCLTIYRAITKSSDVSDLSGARLRQKRVNGAEAGVSLAFARPPMRSRCERTTSGGGSNGGCNGTSAIT